MSLRFGLYPWVALHLSAPKMPASPTVEQFTASLAGLHLNSESRERVIALYRDSVVFTAEIEDRNGAVCWFKCFGEFWVRAHSTDDGICLVTVSRIDDPRRYFTYAFQYANHILSVARITGPQGELTCTVLRTVRYEGEDPNWFVFTPSGGVRALTNEMLEDTSTNETIYVNRQTGVIA